MVVMESPSPIHALGGRNPSVCFMRLRRAADYQYNFKISSNLIEGIDQNSLMYYSADCFVL